MIENIELFGVNLGVDEKNPKLIQDIFNILHPIDEVIIQYPNQKSPVELFNNGIIYSVWEEQLQYNSAFFRSDKPPIELWTNDGGIHFYRGANKNYPVSINGLTNGYSTGATEYNDEEDIIYTKWRGWTVGNGNNFNDSLQINQNKSHKHENTVSITQQAAFQIANSYTAITVVTRRSPSWSYTVWLEALNNIGSIDEGDFNSSNTCWKWGQESTYRYDYECSHRHIIDNSKTKSLNISINNINDGGDEGRPDNYTFRIWKRIA